jgi:hypothetical protein
VAGRFIGRFFGRTISDGAAFAIGASTSRTLNPILQEVANAAWDKHPDAPLSPEEAAALDAADQWTPEHATQEARYSGLNGSRYAGLRYLTEEGLDLSQAFEAWRRGLLDDDGFTAALQKARVAPRWRTTLRGLRNVLLTPQQAASAVERGEMDYADAETKPRNRATPPRGSGSSNGSPGSHRDGSARVAAAARHHRRRPDAARFRAGQRPVGMVGRARPARRRAARAGAAREHGRAGRAARPTTRARSRKRSASAPRTSTGSCGSPATRPAPSKCSTCGTAARSAKTT